MRLRLINLIFSGNGSCAIDLYSDPMGVPGMPVIGLRLHNQRLRITEHEAQWIGQALLDAAEQARMKRMERVA